MAADKNTVALDDRYIMHTYGRLPVEFVEGSGVVLRDSANNEYLDFLAGIGSVSLGHAHPCRTRGASSGRWETTFTRRTAVSSPRC